jgi:hypothetical protein
VGSSLTLHALRELLSSDVFDNMPEEFNFVMRQARASPRLPRTLQACCCEGACCQAMQSST